MTAAQIARELGGKRSGAGYVAKCPAHDDSNPSLSLRDSGGQLLVHCHAGCEQGDVVDALKGLGLWRESASSEISKIERRIVATYDYTNAAGQLLYQVCRYDPKDFRPRYPDAAGVRCGDEAMLAQLLDILFAFDYEHDRRF